MKKRFLLTIKNQFVCRNRSRILFFLYICFLVVEIAEVKVQDFDEKKKNK